MKPLVKNLFASSISKDTWLILTGECVSSNARDEIRLDELNIYFIHGHSAPDLEPLSLPDVLADSGRTARIIPLPKKSPTTASPCIAVPLNVLES